MLVTGHLHVLVATFHVEKKNVPSSCSQIPVLWAVQYTDGAIAAVILSAHMENCDYQWMKFIFKQLGHYLNFNAWLIKNVHIILTEKDEVMK